MLHDHVAEAPELVRSDFDTDLAEALLSNAKELEESEVAMLQAPRVSQGDLFPYPADDIFAEFAVIVA